MKLQIIILLALTAIMMTANIVEGASIMPISCDGKEATNIVTGEVCVYGTGFIPESYVDIYIVEDKENYHPSETLEDVTGYVETVKTSKRGVLPLTKVWDRIKKGMYDIIVDLNRNGKFDANEPVNIGKGQGLRTDETTEFCFYYPEDEICLEEDSEEQDIHAEVPEFTTIGAILALGGIGYYIHRRRR